MLDRTTVHFGIAKAMVMEDLKKEIVELEERHARYKAGEAMFKASKALVDHRALAILSMCQSLLSSMDPRTSLSNC